MLLERDHPAEVVGKVVAQLGVDRAGEERRVEVAPVAQVDHPCPLLQQRRDLVQREVARRGRIEGLRSEHVRRSHVPVVRGVGGESADEFREELLLALHERWVVPLLRADRRRLLRRLRRRAVAPETVRRVDRRTVVDLGSDPADRVELVLRELLRHVGTDEVGASDGPEQHRATREHAELVPLRIEQHVGEVRGGVAGGEQRAHAHQAALEHVAVGQSGPIEADLIVRVQAVGRIEHRGQCVAARHIVVVDVGLDDMGHVEAVLMEHVEDAVDVALRIDDHGLRAVMRDVAAIPQRGGLDGDDVDAAHDPPCVDPSPCPALSPSR